MLCSLLNTDKRTKLKIAKAIWWNMPIYGILNEISRCFCFTKDLHVQHIKPMLMLILSVNKTIEILIFPLVSCLQKLFKHGRIYCNFVREKQQKIKLHSSCALSKSERFIMFKIQRSSKTLLLFLHVLSRISRKHLSVGAQTKATHGAQCYLQYEAWEQTIYCKSQFYFVECFLDELLSNTQYCMKVCCFWEKPHEFLYSLFIFLNYL